MRAGAGEKQESIAHVGGCGVSAIGATKWRWGPQISALVFGDREKTGTKGHRRLRISPVQLELEHPAGRVSLASAPSARFGGSPGMKSNGAGGIGSTDTSPKTVGGSAARSREKLSQQRW